MTWNEYCDIKYFIQKEYHYYLNISGRYNEHEKDFEHYRKLENSIADFEKKIMTEAIKNISKKDFEKMLDK